MTVSRLSGKTHPPYTWSTQCQNPHPHGHKPYATLCTRQMPSEEAFQTKQITSKQGECVCVFAVMLVCVCVSCRSPCQAIYKSKARQGKFLTGKTAGDAPDSIPSLGVITQHSIASSRLHSTQFRFQDFITHWLN